MFWRRRKRLNEEIESHIAEEKADNIARGMDPKQAANAALRTFGNIEAAKEKARELDPLYWLDTLSQDIRFAFRLIGRNRWTSLTIVATLTLGIALNVSVFTLLNALLLRPWIRTQPETFLSVIPRYSGEYTLRFSDGGMSQPDYLHYRSSAKSLESLAAHKSLSLSLSGQESGTIRAALASCNLFDVVKPGQPLLGRYMMPDECTTPMQAPVAVLSETFWRARYNADSAIVGRVIHLNRLPFLVVGVAPAFTLPGLDGERDVWVPYSMLQSLRPSDDYFSDTRAHWLNVIGRRSPNHDLSQVGQELSVLARSADERVPGRITSVIVTDGSLAQNPEIRSRAPLIFAVTLGTTALLLLLACVNVTTLLLSRSAARQREIAVRLSLGAGRFRLLRQLLTESLVLSGLAAAISFAIAQRAPAALWNSLSLGPPPFDLVPDERALMYCLCVALATGVIAGLSPAIESLRFRVAESLKGSSAAATPGGRRSRLRSALVAVQVALSLLLLVQATLFMRAQRRYFSYDPGFETKQVLNLTLSSVKSGFEPSASFYQELESRVNTIPGVVRTSYVSIVPWNGRNSTQFNEIDGKPLSPTRDYRRDPARRLVSPEYFAALGIPLTRGHIFPRQPSGTTIPTVISEAMARQYWPDQDPVGRRFKTSAVHEIVGVVPDVQSLRFMQNDGPFYYSPLDLSKSKPPAMMIRVVGDTRTAAQQVREAVRLLDPQMAVTVGTLASMVEEQGDSLKPALFYGALAGSLALLLALTGVYGVVSFSVSQRIPEIGIRLALGAQRRDVLSLVLRSGLAPVCGGLIVGIGLAIAAALAIESMLFGFNPRDPLTLTGVPVLLLLAALAAVWIPARRAAALDPLVSLRYE